ncbi:hypothetical protein ALO44_200124 [Pseudomonas syringae pv. tagetis]|uniref:Uncharacterized protein n=1 Tax=Pseudomonas syringae pv. tagetis TaxID=129140 RepID=A0A0Q0C297_9PSED|nr:hypothetical protein ALO44_200124 [Pseudomonas syringae pv. tagetis]
MASRQAWDLHVQITFKRFEVVMHIAVERLWGAVLLLLVLHSPQGVIPKLRQGCADFDPWKVRVFGIEA